VSYALSGKRTISSETRRRIEGAISDLGFIPNAGAIALATSQTHVIGLMVHFDEDEFAPAMLQYILPIADSARELGYDILLVTDQDAPGALTRVTHSNMVDAVVLLSVVHDDNRLEPLRSAKQPGALVGLPHDTEGLDVYDLDFGEAARLLVDHLHERGHQEIVLITPPKHVFGRGGAYSWRFRNAAMERAARYGIHMTSHYGESRQPAINESLNRVLDTRSSATAMIVHNDASVAALPSVLQDRGIRVPEHLSVVSLFSKDFGKTFNLPYTAVETSPDELGRLAVQQVIKRLRSAEAAGTPVVRFVQPKITDAGSTAHVRPTAQRTV